MTFRPWLAHYDNGVPQVIDFPCHPVFHFLEESARIFPHQPCTIFQESVISYREMDALARAAAEVEGRLGRKLSIEEMAELMQLPLNQDPSMVQRSPAGQWFDATGTQCERAGSAAGRLAGRKRARGGRRS